MRLKWTDIAVRFLFLTGTILWLIAAVHGEATTDYYAKMANLKDPGEKPCKYRSIVVKNSVLKTNFVRVSGIRLVDPSQAVSVANVSSCLDICDQTACPVIAFYFYKRMCITAPAYEVEDEKVLTPHSVMSDDTLGYFVEMRPDHKVERTHCVKDDVKYAEWLDTIKPWLFEEKKGLPTTSAIAVSKSSLRSDPSSSVSHTLSSPSLSGTPSLMTEENPVTRVESTPFAKSTKAANEKGPGSTSSTHQEKSTVTEYTVPSTPTVGIEASHTSPSLTVSKASTTRPTTTSSASGFPTESLSSATVTSAATRTTAQTTEGSSTATTSSLKSTPTSTKLTEKSTSTSPSVGTSSTSVSGTSPSSSSSASSTTLKPTTTKSNIGGEEKLQEYNCSIWIGGVGIGLEDGESMSTENIDLSKQFVVKAQFAEHVGGPVNGKITATTRKNCTVVADYRNGSVAIVGGAENETLPLDDSVTGVRCACENLEASSTPIQADTSTTLVQASSTDATGETDTNGPTATSRAIDSTTTSFPESSVPTVTTSADLRTTTAPKWAGVYIIMEPTEQMSVNIFMGSTARAKGENNEHWEQAQVVRISVQPGCRIVVSSERSKKEVSLENNGKFARWTRGDVDGIGDVIAYC